MIGDLQQGLLWSAAAAGLGGAVLLRGLYAGMETGIYVLNKLRLELRAEAGKGPAALLKKALADPNNLLAVLLIGTNVASYLATFIISAMFVQAGFGARSEWYTIAVATPALFIFGESIPKGLFQRLAETLVYRLAWLPRASGVLFNACGLAPLVRGFSWLLMRLGGLVPRRQTVLGHEGLAAVLAEGQASGVLTHFQTMMADRVMRLKRVTLREAMIPMKQVVTAPRGLARDELMKRMRDHNYSRLPLLDDSGRVFGVLDLYDVMAGPPDQPPAEKLTAPLVLPADANVSDALYQMQKARAAMAVVADRDGRHAGIVTVKDLVEEIVGELEAW